MRILGIDVGSSSIKIVEMDSAFGRFDIHDYHEHTLIPGENPYQALTQLILSLPKAADRTVIALPSSRVTLRNLQLPTREKKAIQAGVGFELEDELPFPTEDCQFDYTILSQNKQGSSIHAAATLKKHLHDTITAHLQGEVDPDLITTEAWAYRLLLNRVLTPTGAPKNIGVIPPVLLINLGHNTTTLYLQWNGSPIFIREIHWGGKNLIQAISEKFQISFEQAETATRDRGIVFSSSTQKEVSPEQSEIAECLEANLREFYSEIRQTELMCKNLTSTHIELIYLTGGTSLLSGLPEWIENKTHIQTRLLPTLSALTSSGVTYSDQTNARFSLAAALAYCLVGNQKGTNINFRKGRFLKRNKSREINIRAIRKPLIAASLVLGCLILSLIVQSTVYSAKLLTLNDTLERQARAFFKNTPATLVRNYLADPATLRTGITKEMNRQKELARLAAPNPRSPLDLLKSFSVSIPKDLIVDLAFFQSGTPAIEPYSTKAPTANLAFVIANPQIGERLNQLLESRMTGLKRGTMEEFVVPETQSKKWKLSFSGIPNEDNYGK